MSDIKILKDWLESDDNSTKKLLNVHNACILISSSNDIGSLCYAVAWDAIHSVSAAFAADAAVAAYADARGKVKELVDLLESHTSNNTNNNDNAQKLSELSKDELIETFGNVPINKLDFTLNDLIKALK